jgi:hypothetical protein
MLGFGSEFLLNGFQAIVIVISFDGWECKISACNGRISRNRNEIEFLTHKFVSWKLY